MPSPESDLKTCALCGAKETIGNMWDSETCLGCAGPCDKNDGGYHLIGCGHTEETA